METRFNSMNSFESLLLSDDSSPRIIGKFMDDTNGVWVSIRYSKNGTTHVLADRVSCYRILNTNRWACSLCGIDLDRYPNITYRMESDTKEIFCGEFNTRKGDG